jgi:hypothetical protein
MLRRPGLDRLHRLLIILLLLSNLVAFTASAGQVILHLKSGDRISGSVISEGESQTVISNGWAAQLSVPRDQIERIEKVENHSPIGIQPGKHVIAEGLSNTNRWKGEAQVGLNLRFGAIDQQLYYGRFKLAYEKPYESDPKKSFRNGFDYSVEYGRTASVPTSGGTNKESVISSDRMSGADKMAFDFTRRWYAYNLVGAGYDHVKKIDFQYEAGPGIGYHLLTRTNYSLNVESGLNYQAQYRKDNPDVQDVYYRLAEEFTCKFVDRFSLIERFEYFPRLNWADYRMRFESTLSYDFFRNLSLNLTVLDLYDTHPASTVSENDVQIRSALGVKF